MRASGINRVFMQARSLSAGPEIAPSSAAGMPAGSEGNAQPVSGVCAIVFWARAPASVAVTASTAKPAIAITLRTDLFTLSLLVNLRPRAIGYVLGPAIYAHGDALDGLRHERGGRDVDLAAGDVGRGTSDAERGHHASALSSL